MPVLEYSEGKVPVSGEGSAREEGPSLGLCGGSLSLEVRLARCKEAFLPEVCALAVAGVLSRVGVWGREGLYRADRVGVVPKQEPSLSLSLPLRLRRLTSGG